MAADRDNERKGGGPEGQDEMLPLQMDGASSVAESSKEVHVVEFIDSASESFDVYQTEVPVNDVTSKELKDQDHDHGVKQVKMKKGKDEWQVTNMRP